jgi:hypothetical protein
MFLDSGDGLVFKGAMGPWYSSATKEFHLSSQEAKRLIETVVRSYEEIHGRSPRELFIHGKTRFNDSEWEGFRAGSPAMTSLVAVRITRSQDMKLFRMGPTPVLRGTAYRIGRNRALLWTMGYIPRLRTAPQVFNFDVVFAPLGGGATGFFCSTEDGALWMGRTDSTAKIAIDGHEPIGAALGSALCVAGSRLAATAYDLHEFIIG